MAVPCRNFLWHGPRRCEANNDQRRILEEIPKLDAAVMCSECPSPLEWHERPFPVGHPAEPCPAWPVWKAHREAIWKELRERHERRVQEEAAAKPKVKPIAVIPSGLPIEEITVRLSELQAKHPGAIVRRGSANKWEIWPPRERKAPACLRRSSGMTSRHSDEERL